MMIDKIDDDFGKKLNTLKNIQISSTSLHVDDLPITENEECSKIAKSEAFQPKSYCYSKLSSMDFVLKNMHKRWSIID
jgi:hypothetical protein